MEDEYREPIRWNLEAIDLREHAKLPREECRLLWVGDFHDRMAVWGTTPGETSSTTTARSLAFAVSLGRLVAAVVAWPAFIATRTQINVHPKPIAGVAIAPGGLGFEVTW